MFGLWQKRARRWGKPHRTNSTRIQTPCDLSCGTPPQPSMSSFTFTRNFMAMSIIVLFGSPASNNMQWGKPTLTWPEPDYGPHQKNNDRFKDKHRCRQDPDVKTTRKQKTQNGNTVKTLCCDVRAPWPFEPSRWIKLPSGRVPSCTLHFRGRMRMLLKNVAHRNHMNYTKHKDT